MVQSKLNTLTIAMDKEREKALTGADRKAEPKENMVNNKKTLANIIEFINT